MRILLATRSLGDSGGSETYTETVAVELRQLGHDVELCAPRTGAVANRLRSAGFTVHESIDAVGEAPDVAHVQHASSALRVRARFPKLAMVYVCHSSIIDLEDPPLPAAPQVLVALSDRTEARLAASAVAEHASIVRLRQPLRIAHTESSIVPVADPPRRALLAGHRARLVEPRVRAACTKLGIELECMGQTGSRVDDLTPAIMRADIVFAVGRTLLEAMALGRAAFLLDDRGSGGFVTAERFEAFEAAAFAATDAEPVTTGRLREELARYDASLGHVGFELVRRRHSARAHVRDIVSCYRRAMAADAPGSPSELVLMDAYASLLEREFEHAEALRQSLWRSAELEREIHRIYRKPLMRWARALRERRGRA